MLDVILIILNLPEVDSFFDGVTTLWNMVCNKNIQNICGSVHESYQAF